MFTSVKNEWEKLKHGKKKPASGIHSQLGAPSRHSPSPAPSASGSVLSFPGAESPSGLDSQTGPPPNYFSVVGSQNPQPSASSSPPATGKSPDTTLSADKPTPVPAWMDNLLTGSLRTLKIMAILTGAPALDSFAESSKSKTVVGKEGLEKHLGQLMVSIEPLIAEGSSNAPQKMKDGLRKLYSSLSAISNKIRETEDDEVFLEGMGREFIQTVDSFMLVSCISGIITLTDTLVHVEKHMLAQSVQSLPRVEAAYNDYESKKKTGACFEGTREALLDEIARWISALEKLQIYLLSGIAGVGKSTIAYTVAERAERAGYLGASFFFSRDKAERSNAKNFFTTIAHQLCLYNKEFSRAIENALLTERGSAAVTKDPITQLAALILEPLGDIVKSWSSPIVMVVDALDECDERDSPTVLAALNQLVHELPCFKVIVTTRPQPRLPPNPSSHKTFYLQDVEDKIIDGDIRHYLKHSLSWEQVKAVLPGIEDEWSANNENIESLVRATGRLFIMASTAVRFILDSTVYDPRLQLEILEANERAALKGLKNFYDVVLRRAVPLDDQSMVERFKDVVGTILVAQEPLPVKVLGQLTQPRSSHAIKAALVNLQSVISLHDAIPRIYHKSFPDYLTDTRHCAKDLLIDIMAHHTQVAARCFQIMNKYLKQNILNLGTPARFMNNEDAFVADKISSEQLEEKIPGVLRYACTYWANHMEGADATDVKLIQEVYTFVTEHLLHWLEALSLVGKLDVAYPAVRVLSNSMKSTSDLRDIITDALRFISRSFAQIQRSALHTYYSALPFTPTDRPLYNGYSKDMKHGLFRLEGIPPQWEVVLAFFSHGLEARHLIFSRDGTKLASSSEDQRIMRLWDGENGALLRTYEGDNLAISNDFSITAISRDRAVTLWSVARNEPVAMLTQSETVVNLTLSFDGSRLAAGLSSGTVALWDAEKGIQIDTLTSYAHRGQLGFAPSDYRLAFISDDGAIRIWNGSDGSLIGGSDYESKGHVKFVFSRDGSRLASLVKEASSYALTLWDGEAGNFINVAQDTGSELAISEDGSLIATGSTTVQLWRGTPLAVADTVDIGHTISCLAISCDILAVGTTMNTLMLYDIANKAVIGARQSVISRSLALSPDCTRLAVGDNSGALCDVLSVRASPGKERFVSAVTALVFSPDSSQLASGCDDGTVALWNSSQIDFPIASSRIHSERITTLTFSLDGGRFASGSQDKTVRLWDLGDLDGLTSELQHSFASSPTALALSPDLFVAATIDSITLFNPTSLSPIDTLEHGGNSLALSADGSLLASAHNSSGRISVWNIAERAVVAAFALKSDIRKLMFSHDGSKLAAQSVPFQDGHFEFFDIVNKQTFELTGREDLSWLPNFMNNNVLVMLKVDEVLRCRLVAQFPGRQDWIPVLWLPAELGIWSLDCAPSAVALGLADGRIFFVRLTTCIN